MPRRGGGGFGGNRGSRSRSTSQSPPRTASKPTFTKPQAAPQQRGGFLSGMAGTFMTGMALGAGSEVAHQGVRGLMGGGSHQEQMPAEYDNSNQTTQQQQQPMYCSNETQSFIECLKKNNDISFCQIYSDALKECQKKYGM